MKIIIKAPDKNLIEYIKNNFKIQNSPLHITKEINHITIILKDKSYYLYRYNPLQQELFCILPITTIEQLNIVIVWYDLGMTFEEIKTCLGDEL